MDLSDFRLKLAIVQDLEEGNVFVTANPVEVKLEKKVCLHVWRECFCRKQRSVGYPRHCASRSPDVPLAKPWPAA